MSQQEDDLRALAKIMDFLRAVSIILVVAHLYWYCYEAIQLWGVNIGVVDRILRAAIVDPRFETRFGRRLVLPIAQCNARPA